MENVFEPKLLKDFPSNIRCFDTYAFHSLAVTEDNRLLGWGGNKYSQIKTSPTKMFYKPVEIPHTIKSPIVDVKCGSTHSLLLTADGDIYAWGKNSQSQLGQDFIFADSCGTPSPIAAPKDTFFDQIIAACDFNFAKSVFLSFLNVTNLTYYFDIFYLQQKKVRFTVGDLRPIIRSLMWQAANAKRPLC